MGGGYGYPGFWQYCRLHRHCFVCNDCGSALGGECYPCGYGVALRKVSIVKGEYSCGGDCGFLCVSCGWYCLTSEEQQEWDAVKEKRDEPANNRISEIIAQSQERELATSCEEQREPHFHYP